MRSRYKQTTYIKGIASAAVRLLLFITIGVILFKLKVNFYLAVLLAWLLVALLPAVVKPKEKVIQGMQYLIKDKAAVKAFARTALIVGLFSFLANTSLRYYFWGIAAINLLFAGIIAYRLYRTPQTQSQS
ncbi:MAG: hypothetical protein WA118_05705 [Carboxydocellales bacterium]